ncbi:endonuclease/exonuclease/phosphatase family protein [uncultured Psychroserpens sp.]|uniref:endonuclease/exonuclease/phosphatase family protein n=1 Tax=uncultured Psychroserpens sp. TaxID=255436 RepID=UPI00263252EB|nr:endonuclease/exonuclease/phosphatase family protein [uncultured Psychroserpens sp.]
MNLKLKQNYKAYLLIGYAFLLLIHFVFKDHIYPISTLFYSFPIPIIIIIGSLIILLHIRKKVHFYCLFITLLGLVFYWLSNFYYVQIDKTIPLNTSKILYWNVAKKPQLPLDIIIEQTKEHQPKVLAFVEAKYITQNDLDILKKVLPDYTFKDLYAHMLVGVKGKINSAKIYAQKKSHEAYLINATINNKTVNFIVVDIYAYPFVNKKPALDSIIDVAKTHNASFIVGDFNTPYESVHFLNYHKNYTSFHTYNNGFTATWPLGIPLMEIDHIWLSNKYSPVSLEKEYHSESDHALLIAEYKNQL